MSPDSRPRLLVLASTYPRWAGDPEPGFVHELSKRLTSQFRVTVLTPHASGSACSEELDGVEVVRYRYAPDALETLVNDGGIVANLRGHAWKWLLLPSFLLAQLFAVWKLARSQRPDIIHAHWIIPQGFALALLARIGVRIPPFVLTSHGADLYALNSWPLRAAKRFVVRRAAALTVVSHAMVAPLRALGASNDRISVRPMGADLQGIFRPGTELTRNSDELLFVGRLVEKKGLEYLINAMPSILARRPDARLTIVGFGPDEGRMIELVKALGLQARVEFVGAVPQSRLPDFYRRAAVFVAPFVRARSGDQEGLGLVVAEAAGCGCPVVVGNVPAMQEFPFTPVDATDTDALAGAIVGILENPAVSREAAVGHGDVIRQRLDWANVALGYAALLQASKTCR